MDFFQRQEIARRNTKLLEVYFALSVIATVLLVYAAAILVFNVAWNQHSDPDNPVILWDGNIFGVVSLVTIIIIFVGSICKISQLSGGGSVVAEMLGGQPIDGHTADLGERRLLNVVEEMAIASGTPVPQLYLLPGEDGINAFAAGHTTGDMVICVTAGSLKYLTRDELQGVIGHEFSHILNGDMRLNLRLMGIIFGILSLTLIGRILMQTRGEKNPLPLIGLLLLAVGGIGYFFAKLIKSAVNRQREFLADAASAQFTRNPEGLANALKKVGNSYSRIDDANAEDVSHLFFANGMTESFFNWMSTHPPLEERIRELDPHWDGQFISLAPRPPGSQAETERVEDEQRAANAEKLQKIFASQALPAAVIAGTAIASTAVLPQIGAPTARHLDYAADVMAKINDSLLDAARNSMSAAALVYALLLNPDATIRKSQMARLQDSPVMAGETDRLFQIMGTLESRARLPLVTLCIGSLRNLSEPQYAQFTSNIASIIALNGQTDLFAYVLQKIVLRRLAPHFNPPGNKVPQYYALKPLLPDCAILLSALACAGQTEPGEIKSAFDLGVKQLGVSTDEIRLDMTAYDLTKIDAALNRLNQAAPQIKKTVISACAETVAADGVIQEAEAELLRAIADTLDCPIPPFLSV